MASISHIISTQKIQRTSILHQVQLTICVQNTHLNSLKRIICSCESYLGVWNEWRLKYNGELKFRFSPIGRYFAYGKCVEMRHSGKIWRFGRAVSRPRLWTKDWRHCGSRWKICYQISGEAHVWAENFSVARFQRLIVYEVDANTQTQAVLERQVRKWRN